VFIWFAVPQAVAHIQQKSREHLDAQFRNCGSLQCNLHKQLHWQECLAAVSVGW